MTVSREMPKYQCHKQVWALKIKAIGEGSSNSEFAILQFEEAGYGPLPVSADWHFKHKPEPGGFYVVYEDGYKSYSPASAFESGYSLCNPHTGALRDPRDVASDPQAILCTKPGEPLKAAPGPVVFGDEEHVAVPRGLIGAACSAIEHKREGTSTLAELRRYTFGDKSAALPQAASIALPVVDPGPDSLEREIQAKANKGPRVTPADIEAEIVSGHYFTAFDGVAGAGYNEACPDGVLRSFEFTAPGSLDLLTFCVLVLRNGAKVVGVNYGAIDPAQHSAERGRQAARKQAEEKVWELLGFRLRDELARPVLTDADAAADLAGTPRPDRPGA